MPGGQSGLYSGIERLHQSEEYKQYEAENDLFRAVGRDRLLELAQAEKDGRLVVLPCKVGDTLYHISWGRIIETKVRTFFLGHPSHNIETRNLRMIRTTDFDISMDEIGKRIFLTREEAEAALKRR